MWKHWTRRNVLSTAIILLLQIWIVNLSEVEIHCKIYLIQLKSLPSQWMALSYPNDSTIWSNQMNETSIPWFDLTTCRLLLTVSQTWVVLIDDVSRINTPIPAWRNFGFVFCWRYFVSRYLWDEFRLSSACYISWLFCQMDVMTSEIVEFRRRKF